MPFTPRTHKARISTRCLGLPNFFRSVTSSRPTTYPLLQNTLLVFGVFSLSSFVSHLPMISSSFYGFWMLSIWYVWSFCEHCEQSRMAHSYAKKSLCAKAACSSEFIKLIIQVSIKNIINQMFLIQVNLHQGFKTLNNILKSFLEIITILLLKILSLFGNVFKSVQIFMSQKSDSYHFTHLLRHLNWFNIRLQVLRVKEHYLCTFWVVELCREIKRRFTVNVPPMRLDSVRKQQLHDLVVASHAGPHQSRLASRINTENG